jgi:hypothetical protein
MSTLRVDALANAAGTAVASMAAGTLTLEAGGTTRPPMVLQGGPLLTSPQAGAVEYSGNVFYSTPDATAGEAINVTEHFYALGADRTLVATVVLNTFYSAFGVALPVVTNSSYVFDILVGMRTGATSHTVSFHWGGTAVLGDCNFRTEFTNLALSTGAAGAGTPTAPVSLQFTGNPALATNGVISPASTIVSKFFRVSGILTVTTAGTLIPEVAFSANPTGTNQITRLSYVKLYPVGLATGNVVVGNWA